MNGMIKKLRKNLKTNNLNKYLLYLDSNNYIDIQCLKNYHKVISNGVMIYLWTKYKQVFMKLIFQFQKIYIMNLKIIH